MDAVPGMKAENTEPAPTPAHHPNRRRLATQHAAEAEGPKDGSEVKHSTWRHIAYRGPNVATEPQASLGGCGP
jgi:hypothetical protein